MKKTELEKLAEELTKAWNKKVLKSDAVLSDEELPFEYEIDPDLNPFSNDWKGDDPFKWSDNDIKKMTHAVNEPDPDPDHEPLPKTPPGYNPRFPFASSPPPSPPYLGGPYDLDPFFGDSANEVKRLPHNKR